MSTSQPSTERLRVTPRKTRATSALAFVALALIALAVVPIYFSQRAARAQEEISETLQPALEASARLSLAQARVTDRFQRFLLTDDRSLRTQYNAEVAIEDSLFTELGGLVRVMDFEVRERLAQVSAESARWHFENRRAFDEPDRGDIRAALVAESLTSFDNLEIAARELERVIESQVREGGRESARLLRLQFWVTLALAAVALASTLVLGLVSRRLRTFMAEADQRRSQAVRSQREIDALLEATGEGVLGIDLEGKCTSLNRVGCVLLGFSEREIRGRDMHDTVHHSTADGEPRDREDSVILAALGEGGRVDSGDEDVLWRRDRTSFPSRWSLHPLVDGTDVRGAVLTFGDISEIRDKETALRRAVYQREEVVSIVSHDLRNPLGVVAAAADLLIELPLDEKERRLQAEIIARSAGRMGRLIEDLLDVARIEAGAFVVRPSAERVRPILEEAIELSAHQAEQAGVALLVEVASHVPPARMDRDRILQALTNLIDNALRFTARGGSVTLGGVERDGRVALSVSDTGEGIAPDAVDRLFDRFWQTEGAGKGVAGLGLAIVRGIVEAHEGEVQVESEQGVGTTFVLLLPSADVAAATEA
ncbi:MAG TPA: PAS domain-containing sensor histidine kinase [Gemmatimonadetes bacterium]|nr:PAS domain-containing sensor histidine kinase [Gemmatimonadota bacterium]